MTASRTARSTPARSPRSTVETITIREFATGKKVTATLDTECTPALVEDDDATADDSAFDDGASDEAEEGDFFQDEDEDEDFGEDEESCDDDDALDKGVVLQSAELEDGYLTAYVLA